MKSCKAEVNVQGRMSRLGLFSLISVMILFVSVGKTFAADDANEFQLWHKQLNSEEKGESLRHMRSGREFNDAYKLLVDKPDFEAYVKKYADEPFEFMEGVQSVLLDSLKDTEQDPKEVLASLVAGFDKVSNNDYNGWRRHDGYGALLDWLKGLPKSELIKLLKDPAFLKKLFDHSPKDPNFLERLLYDFSLVGPGSKKEKPTPTATSTPTPFPTASPTSSPTAVPTQVNNDDEARRRAEQEARNRDEFQNRIEQQLKDMKQQLKAVQQPPQVIPTAIPQRATGEVKDDSYDQRIFYCKQLDALKQGLFDQLNSTSKALSDLANQTFNQLASTNRFPTTNNRNNSDKQLADVLLPLLQDNNRNQSPVQPPPAIPQAPRPPQSFNDVQPNQAFNQLPQPTPPPQEPPPPPPMYLPPMQGGATNQPITLNLPQHSGQQELSDANSTIAQSQALLGRKLPQTINPFNGQQMPPYLILPSLQSEQTKTKRVLSMAQANLQAVKDQRARLQGELDQLKDGGRAALPSWVKQEQQRLQSEYDSKKQDFDQRKQFAQQAVQQGAADPMQTQQQMMQEQQQVNQAKAELDKFRQQVESKVEEGNKAIASLKSKDEQLGKAETNLQSQVGQLQDRDQEIDTNLQQEYAMLTQPPQQPQSTTQNVNKIAQMGQRPTTSSPIGRAMSSQPAKPVRGSLGGGLGGMTAGSSSAGSGQ